MITEPIKDNKELQAFLNFYADKKPNLRNHCLIVFGLNTALRISDILNIKWNMIYDFENKKFIKRLTISEHKTGKINIIPINQNLDNIVENTTAAESAIRDTDMAEEMVAYSKNSILTQAGQSMLAQANQSNQGVLSLLQ